MKKTKPPAADVTGGQSKKNKKNTHFYFAKAKEVD